MGCITSKNLLVTCFNKHHYDQYHDHRIQALNNIKNHDDENNEHENGEGLKCGSRLLLLSSEEAAENVAAAGWPSWLCEVAAEAVRGWLPLKSDSYEKFEKVIVTFIYVLFYFLFPVIFSLIIQEFINLNWFLPKL